MTQPIDIRLPFNETHYVERPLEVAEALRWLTDDRDRVLLVTSPPATGKTWFLRDTQRTFDQKDDVLTFWIDVKALLPQSAPLIDIKQDIDPDKQNAWVRAFAQDLQNRCEHVPPFLPAMNDGEYIEIAMRALCSEDCYPSNTVVIFVDQGDEVTDNSWRLFEKKVLERFFSVGRIKFVIAFRQDQRLYSKLKWMQRFLPLGIFSEGVPGNRPGEEQIEKLTRQNPSAKYRAQELFDSIPAYKKNHSGLNTFLCLYATQSPQLPLSINALKAALLSINPLIGGEIDAVTELLVGIANFPDEWTDEEWATRQNIPLAEAQEQTRKLIEYELLVNVSPGITNRYIVLEGLREFIWAVLETTSTISIETKSNDPKQVVRSVERITGVGVETLIRSVADGSSITITLPSEMAYYFWDLFRNKDRRIQENRITDVQYSTLKQLAEQIDYYFSDNEFRELCLCVEVPFERLGGDNKRRRIFDLVDYCRRHGLLEALLACLRDDRSFVDWRL